QGVEPVQPGAQGGTGGVEPLEVVLVVRLPGVRAGPGSGTTGGRRAPARPGGGTRPATGTGTGTGTGQDRLRLRLRRPGLLPDEGVVEGEHAQPAPLAQSEDVRQDDDAQQADQ